jgi:hypothetical protein
LFQLVYQNPERFTGEGEGCEKEKKKRSHGVLDFFLTMLSLRLVSVPWSMMGEVVKFP